MKHLLNCPRRRRGHPRAAPNTGEAQRRFISEDLPENTNAQSLWLMEELEGASPGRKRLPASGLPAPGSKRFLAEGLLENEPARDRISADPRRASRTRSIAIPDCSVSRRIAWNQEAQAEYFWHCAVLLKWCTAKRKNEARLVSPGR